MKEIYDNYYKHFVRLNADSKKMFDGVADTYLFWYQKFLPSNKNANILDIGCGMGHFLYLLKREGYQNFSGIDISAQQVEFCKENITEKVMVADLYEFLKKGEKFDAIATHDVIEHQPKEKLLEFLRLIFESLRDGGVVFIKTPNMSNPFSLRGRYIDITHELGFTEQSLKEVLEVAGFKDINLIAAYPPVKTVRSLARRILTVTSQKILGFMFFTQGYPVPKILTENIVVVAKKS